MPEAIEYLRTAVRSLRRRPTFTMLVVATLALGVGATSVVFALANQLLLSPLPGVRHTGDAAYLQFRAVEAPDRPSGLPPIDFVELRRAATILEGIAAFGAVSVHVSVAGSAPLAVSTGTVHGDFFEVLGVAPVRGRLLAANETSFGADPLVAVISERLWVTLFGRSEDVVGQTMTANGHAVTVVGVAGGGFAGARRHDDFDMWVPFSALVPLAGFEPETLQSRESTMHSSLLLRPRRGVSLTTAEAQLGAILREMAAGNPENGAYLASLRPRIFPGLHTPPLTRDITYRSLAILSGIVGLLLLISCANVANLLLFRGITRQGESATRRALGATGGRVGREAMTESLLLGALGSTAGVLLGWALAGRFRGQRLIVRAEEFQGLTLDIRLIVFAVTAVVLTTLLFGVLPAVLSSRGSLADALRSADRHGTRRSAGLRYAVASLQFALCVPLLVGALLLTRTVRELNSVDLGLAPDGLVTVGLFGGPSETLRQPERHRELLDRLEALPGVESAALQFYGVFDSRFSDRIRLPGQPVEAQSLVWTEYVSSGWLELLSIRPVSGRLFQPRDATASGRLRAVISAPLARRLFGRTDVTGQTLLTGGRNAVEAEIIGVVGDLRSAGPGSEAQEMMFLPYPHRPDLPMVSVLLRPRQFDAATAGQLRQTFSSFFPELPAPEPALLTARIERQLAEHLLLARLLRLVTILAVALVAVGLYGVVAFTVASRRRELAIRIALGATTVRIARIVVAQAFTIAAVGVLIGLPGALIVSRVLQAHLFGVPPATAIGYAGPALFLAALALAASWQPLRSAAQVDPVIALKEV